MNELYLSLKCNTRQCALLELNSHLVSCLLHVRRDPTPVYRQRRLNHTPSHERWERALDLFGIKITPTSAAAKLHPNFLRFLIDSRCHQVLDDNEQALKHLDTALALDAKFDRAYFLRGIIRQPKANSMERSPLLTELWL